MPFASEFDDVYATIKGVIESSTMTQNGRCFRLDDARPAGRITDRLLSELRAATLCVADLTGNKPNVMWELGFAMALGKPAIVVTQTLNDLPFDIKDMQSIEYQRHHLNSSLSIPLLTSRLRIGQPTAAQGLELDAIAAVVLGGTSLFGGRGGVVGTFVAVMLLQVLRNLFNLPFVTDQITAKAWWAN